jgi:hypothetical protein
MLRCPQFAANRSADCQAPSNINSKEIKSMELSRRLNWRDTQLRQFVSFGFIIFLTLDAQENMTEVKLFDAFCNKNTP